MTRKYIGGMSGDDIRPVSARDVERVIAANRQYGTVRETRAACNRILARGEWLSDGSGYSVRLARIQ